MEIQWSKIIEAGIDADLVSMNKAGEYSATTEYVKICFGLCPDPEGISNGHPGWSMNVMHKDEECWLDEGSPTWFPEEDLRQMLEKIALTLSKC